MFLFMLNVEVKPRLLAPLTDIRILVELLISLHFLIRDLAEKTGKTMVSCKREKYARQVY